MLGRELAAAGLVVVSGLARGIDGEAHRGALEAGGSPSPCSAAGSTATTRRRTRSSRATIARAWLLVSEYEPGVEPAPWRFPARNRIIAGLSAATVVVEARERSGALITADFALEEGRDVFAVPGEITSSLSAGTNALLKLGAAPLTAPPTCSSCSESNRRSREASHTRLLEQLPRDRRRARAGNGLEPAQVAAALAELELNGLVAEGDGTYRALA